MFWNLDHPLRNNCALLVIQSKRFLCWIECNDSKLHTPIKKHHCCFFFFIFLSLFSFVYFWSICVEMVDKIEREKIVTHDTRLTTSLFSSQATTTKNRPNTKRKRRKITMNSRM